MMETTGQRIHQLRKAHGMSMFDLATVIDGDHAMVSRYEADQTIPHTVQAILIAREFNVSVDWLMEPAVNAWLTNRGYDIPETGALP
jgi:transcriptional regulator with XRE-family HTH domain